MNLKSTARDIFPILIFHSSSIINPSAFAIENCNLIKTDIFFMLLFTAAFLIFTDSSTTRWIFNSFFSSFASVFKKKKDLGKMSAISWKQISPFHCCKFCDCEVISSATPDDDDDDYYNILNGKSLSDNWIKTHIQLISPQLFFFHYSRPPSLTCVLIVTLLHHNGI